MASIYTTGGDTLSDGLQGCNVCDEAIQSAQRQADQRGTEVVLDDDDGSWLVHPADEDGEREPADPYEWAS